MLVGAFHTAVNYMGMIVGHRLKGSGYEEILVESGLVSCGSLRGALSGKACAKLLMCIRVTCET